MTWFLVLVFGVPLLAAVVRFWGRLLRKGFGQALQMAEDGNRGGPGPARVTPAQGLQALVTTPGGKLGIGLAGAAVAMAWPSALPWIAAAAALVYAMTMSGRAQPVPPGRRNGFRQEPLDAEVDEDINAEAVPSSRRFPRDP